MTATNSTELRTTGLVRTPYVASVSDITVQVGVSDD
jgi:hypothetical protein